MLGYAAGITLAVMAWGYLVWAAIDFGSTARGGDGRAWWLLALAAVGAVACLFVGLMLLARLGRAMGLTPDPGAGHGAAPGAGHSAGPGTGSAGGKRAAR